MKTTNNLKTLTLTSVATMALMLGATAVRADMVVEKTTTETMPVSTDSSVTTTTTKTVTTTDPRVISLADFNKNGVMSRDEVGRALFKLFDTDGNGVIDSNEYERKIIISFAPMERSTVVTYDVDSDGNVEKTQRTYETFMHDTLLSRFDNNKEGISAHELIGRDFNDVDVNHDHQVDLKEWQGTYIASIDAANRVKADLNK
jgi:hypothetical protein